MPDRDPPAAPDPEPAPVRETGAVVPVPGADVAAAVYTHQGEIAGLRAEMDEMRTWRAKVDAKVEEHHALLPALDRRVGANDRNIATLSGQLLDHKTEMRVLRRGQVRMARNITAVGGAVGEVKVLVTEVRNDLRPVLEERAREKADHARLVSMADGVRRWLIAAAGLLAALVAVPSLVTQLYQMEPLHTAAARWTALPLLTTLAVLLILAIGAFVWGAQRRTL